jgi:arylsulfatase A-like enzyme
MTVRRGAISGGRRPGRAARIPVLGLCLVLFAFCRGRETDVLAWGVLDHALRVEDSLEPPRAAPAAVFFQGWMRDGAGTSAISRVSKLRLYHAGPGPLSLVGTASDPRPDGSVLPLVISVVLNGAPVGEIQVGRKSDFRFDLPAEKLAAGDNIIAFQAGDPAVPRTRGDEPATEIFSLSRIALEPGSPPPSSGSFTRNGARFLQPAGSRFRLAIPAGTKSLGYAFSAMARTSRPARLVVRRIDGALETVLAEMTLAKREKRTGSLELAASGKEAILECELTSRSSGSSLVWEKLAFSPAEPEPRAAAAPAALTGRPDVVLIVLDAARFDVIGREIKGIPVAPRLTAFSREAASFLHCYANAPYTTASMTTLFTGLLPETHGVRGLFSRLPASVRTLPSLFRERDYVSTAVLGNVVPESNNLVKDFDEILSIRSTDPQAAENGSDMAMAAADEAVDRLADDKRRFLYIHLLPPHRPYHPPAPFRDLFVRSGDYSDAAFKEAARDIEKYGLEDVATRDFLFGCYLNNMAYADHLLGGILDRLKDSGAYDDALIVVCADHGDAFGEHGAFGHNATAYQEAVHVPLIVKLPGPRKGIEIPDPVSLVDLLPTLAALLRLKSDPNWQGVPLPFEAGRGGKRIVTCRAEGERLTAALIEGRHKYAFQLGRDELYDLDADPGETVNLAGREPVLTLRLKQELFRRIAANLALREKLGIRTSESREIPARIERELRTLGYL